MEKRLNASLDYILAMLGAEVVENALLRERLAILEQQLVREGADHASQERQDGLSVPARTS